MRSRSQQYPVSVKGVVIRDDRVLLLRNERAEWELPGGKLELGEDPADCVAREIYEEAGWHVTIGPILDAWQYHIFDGADVLVLTYGCHTASTTDPVVSHEHNRAGLFTQAEAAGLPMPDGYKKSIAAWYSRIRLAPDKLVRPDVMVTSSGRTNPGEGVSAQSSSGTAKSPASSASSALDGKIMPQISR
jgi:8-oxo-dGTP pyrophosphatase MutT (NUDIX family)